MEAEPFEETETDDKRTELRVEVLVRNLRTHEIVRRATGYPNLSEHEIWQGDKSGFAALRVFERGSPRCEVACPSDGDESSITVYIIPLESEALPGAESTTGSEEDGVEEVCPPRSVDAPQYKWRAEDAALIRLGSRWSGKVRDVAR